MAKQKSIYELISDNIINGKLDENFVLPDDSEEPVKFAAGAMDGMCVYHMRPYEMTTEDYNILEKSVAAVAKGDFEQTDKLWAELGKSASAIQVVDQFQQYIQEHADEIDVKAAYPCVFDIVCNSINKESIKFALEFMELLDTSQDFIMDVVRTIGLSDEFAIFSAWIMRGWDNGNNELFELAQKVNGWGRIHIIELLEPDTEEIRKWLLTEGTKNSIVYAYSALTCWQKSDAEQRLYSSDLTYEEYSGLLTLADALLDEGPVCGISQIDDADKVIFTALSLSDKYDLTIEDYETINSINMWIELDEKYKLSNHYCNTILSSERCKEVTMKAVKQGKGIRLAKKLCLEFEEELILCLENDFNNYKHMCDYLMKDEKYIDRVLDIYRKNLPLDELIEASDIKLEYKEIFQIELPYRFLLQNLWNYPLKGVDLIEKGLKCRDKSCRISALKCIQKWVTTSDTPLSVLSFDLYDAVSEIEPIETDSDARNMIEELISGKIEFSE